MIHVYTNARQDVLYTDKIEYTSEVVEVGDGEAPTVILFVEFVAKNGPGRGLKQRIPLGRVDAITEPGNEEDEAMKAENRAIVNSVQVSNFRDRLENGDFDDYLTQLQSSLVYRQRQLGRVDA